MEIDPQSKKRPREEDSPPGPKEKNPPQSKFSKSPARKNKNNTSSAPESTTTTTPALTDVDDAEREPELDPNLTKESNPPKTTTAPPPPKNSIEKLLENKVVIPWGRENDFGFEERVNELVKAYQKETEEKARLQEAITSSELAVIRRIVANQLGEDIKEESAEEFYFVLVLENVEEEYPSIRDLMGNIEGFEPEGTLLFPESPTKCAIIAFTTEEGRSKAAMRARAQRPTWRELPQYQKLSATECSAEPKTTAYIYAPTVPKETIIPYTRAPLRHYYVSDKGSHIITFFSEADKSKFVRLGSITVGDGQKLEISESYQGRNDFKLRLSGVPKDWRASHLTRNLKMNGIQFYSVTIARDKARNMPMGFAWVVFLNAAQKLTAIRTKVVTEKGETLQWEEPRKKIKK